MRLQITGGLLQHVIVMAISYLDEIDFQVWLCLPCRGSRGVGWCAMLMAVYTGHFAAILDFKNTLFRRIQGIQATSVSQDS